jgi:hypothetical protein
MPDYRVIVKNNRPNQSNISAFHIDSPTNGFPLTGFLLLLRGWIVGDYLHNNKIRLWDTSISSPVCVSALNETRPDVLAAHKLNESSEPCGFSFALNLLNLPPKSNLLLQLESANGDFTTFAELDIQRPRLQTTWVCKRNPILVNSLGRSGSSLLMKLLSKHPEIVIQSPHPYEARLAKFYVNQLLQRYAEYLSGEVNYPPGNLQAVNMHWLHHELSQQQSLSRQYFQLDFNELADFTIKAIDRAYAHVNDSEVTAKPSSRFYSEKSGSGHTARLMMELYPDGHEVFLVRDFRDMYCSMLQFSQQRQTDDFGWQRQHADEYMEVVAERVDQLRVSFESRTKTPAIIRYEDLLTKPRDTLQQLLTDMDLASDVDTIEKMCSVLHKQVEGHQTSKNAEASIQRWEKELNHKQQRHINDLLSHSLSTFGYKV